MFVPYTVFMRATLFAELIFDNKKTVGCLRHPTIKITEGIYMEQTSVKKPNKYRLDVIVILSVLLISITALLVITLTRKSGDVAVVEINGTVVAEYSLSEDRIYTLGEGTNVLVIENGTAYMSYSNCPDHTCERTGKIRYVGETIICLPNRISITIKGDSSGGVDLVS